MFHLANQRSHSILNILRYSFMFTNLCVWTRLIVTLANMAMKYTAYLYQRLRGDIKRGRGGWRRGNREDMPTESFQDPCQRTKKEEENKGKKARSGQMLLSECREGADWQESKRTLRCWGVQKQRWEFVTNHVITPNFSRLFISAVSPPDRFKCNTSQSLVVSSTTQCSVQWNTIPPFSLPTLLFLLYSKGYTGRERKRMNQTK